jgi:polyisoprenoid-binding protein YceI
MPFAARTIAGVLGCLLSGAACAGGPEQYRLDPVHTRVMFAIDHAGFSKAIGTVSGSTGTLVFDPDDWRSAQLKASVPMSRIDLGDAAWNKATLAGNLLDAEEHPTAEFVSTLIEPLDPGRATVHGTLTLRGVSREIALEVTLNAAKRHPLPPFRRTVGFSATTTLSRKAFGIDAWPSVIGDSVELRIEAEAVRGRADDDTPDATDPPEPASSPVDATPEAAPDTTTEPAP